MSVVTQRGDAAVRVSALVSLFRAERFLPGCLDALVSQTLFQRGEMEILCRDAASPESEAEIVRAYQQRYANIHYVREEERVPLYASWNRAAVEARGDFLLAASADDRLTPDAAEVFATALEAHRDCDVVYGDWTECQVDQLDTVDAGVQCSAGEFSHRRLLRYFFLGSQPMWRREAHLRVGGFDESFRIVADHDLVLRLTASGREACHVPQVLGRVGRHGCALSATSAMAGELDRLFDRWVNLPEMHRRAVFDRVEAESGALLADHAARLLCASPPWRGGAPEIFNGQIERATRLVGNARSEAMDLVIAARACLWGDWEEACIKWKGNRLAPRSGARGHSYDLVPLPLLGDRRSDGSGEATIAVSFAGERPLLNVRECQKAYFGSAVVAGLLERVAYVPKDVSLVVWGAGPKGALVRGLLRQHVREIDCFVDSRGLGPFAGRAVRSPDALASFNPRPQVIVAMDPRHHPSVLSQLTRLGFAPEEIICCPAS